MKTNKELYYQCCDEDCNGTLHFDEVKYAKLLAEKEKAISARNRKPLFKEVVKIKGGKKCR